MSELIREAVALVDEVTKDLDIQGPITHRPWIGVATTGTRTSPVYGTATSPMAFVEYRQVRQSTPAGIILVPGARILIMEPIAANGAVGRDEPIDPRDLIVLPDGRTGTIASVEGPADPSTGEAYLHQVFLVGSRLGGSA